MAFFRVAIIRLVATRRSKKRDRKVRSNSFCCPGPDSKLICSFPSLPPPCGFNHRPARPARVSYLRFTSTPGTRRDCAPRHSAAARPSVAFHFRCPILVSFAACLPAPPPPNFPTCHIRFTFTPGTSTPRGFIQMRTILFPSILFPLSRAYCPRHPAADRSSVAFHFHCPI